MNLLLIHPSEVVDRTVRLRDRRAEHIASVIKPDVGGILRAGLVCGAVGTAKVLEIGPGEVIVELDVADEPAIAPRVDLACALCRPKALHRLIRHAAAMGVGRFDLTNSWRVDKSYFASERVSVESLREDAILGCEQGGVTWVPEIAIHRRFVPFVETFDAPSEALRLVLHPCAENLIESEQRNIAHRRVVLAVGPDGGFIEREVESLCERGFVPVSLGPRVLRTEAAVVAALAQIQLLGRLTTA